MQKQNNFTIPAGARILLVRLSAIGDVLHATTVARRIKEVQPDCELSWIVSPPADVLLTNNPYVDHVLAWDRRSFDAEVAKHHFRTAWRQLKEAKRMMHAYHFDIALDIQGLFLSGLITRLSGARRRIGIHERHEGNHFFMSEQAKNIREPHKICRYLSVLQPFGVNPYDFTPGLTLKLTPKLETFAQKFWQEQHIETGNPQRPLLLINLRTTWPDKNWPPEAFAEALNALPDNIQLVFTGAPNDRPYVQKVQSLLRRPSFDVAGKTNLLELAAIFQSADLLLTGDTGPLYIAEAVGLKTLSLWGPTHPDIYGPLTLGHHFIISPHACTACCKTHCKYHTNACMNAIAPAVVATKLKELLC